MDEFTKHKQISERGIDNEQFYQNVKENILESDETIVITIKDGVSSVDLTGGEALTIIGALEHTKFIITHDSIIWEE